MTLVFRIFLLFLAGVSFFYVLWKIRKSRMRIETSVFWICFSILIVIFAIFPQICTWLSKIIGVYSPTNFIFAFMIFILIAKVFSQSLEIARLEYKLQKMAQNLALKENDNRQESTRKNDKAV